MVDYAEIVRTFDTVAPAYDDLYGPSTNELMAWLRRESITVLLDMFPKDAHLLEIGCGTGDDAIRLARAGRTILATDISSAMTSITQDKAQSANLDDHIDVMTLAAGELATLPMDRLFDGAYSNFGPLNCEPDLNKFASTLSQLLRAGSTFICSVMAPICPIEIVWFALHLQPGKALRRLKRGWHPAGIIGPGGTRSTVPTRYLSLRALREAFAPDFALEYAMSLPLVLPPPYLNDVYIKNRQLWNALEPLERRLRDRWPLNRVGDHLLVVMRRR